MKPNPQTGEFSEADMRRAGNPLPAVALAVAVSWFLFGCASGPNITVAQPDVSIPVPAGLMQPPEPMQPAYWTNAKTAPTEDGRPAASKAATAPEAPGATGVAPTTVSPRPAPAPAASSTIPATTMPKHLIPPAPATSTAGKETGLAPMPTAPQK